jgi:hypothetical protein
MEVDKLLNAHWCDYRTGVENERDGVEKIILDVLNLAIVK